MVCTKLAIGLIHFCVQVLWRTDLEPPALTGLVQGLKNMDRNPFDISRTRKPNDDERTHTLRQDLGRSFGDQQ